MQGTNLNINIVGNAEKFNQELTKTELLIKNFTRQASKALTKGDVAGFEAFTAEAAKLKTTLPGLERQLAQVGVTAQATGRSFQLSARSFRSFNSALITVSRSFGVYGTAAFGAYQTISQVSQALDAQIERLVKIRDLARETASKPAAVAAAQNIARSIGEDASIADTVLKKQAELFAKMQQARLKQGGISGVDVFRGGTKTDAQTDAERKLQEMRGMLLGGPQVLRGGQKPTSGGVDLDKAFDLLIDKTKKYADTKEGFLKFQNDQDVAFLKIAKSGRLGAAALNEFSKAVTGLPSETAIPFLTERVAKFNEAMKDAGSINPLLDATKELETQQGLLTNAWNKASEGIVLSYTEMLTRITISTREVLEIAATDWVTAALTAVSRTQGAIVPGIMGWLFGNTWADDARTAFVSLLEWMKNAAIATGQAIAQAWASMRQTLSQSFPGDPGGMPASPFASGGYVTGPGTGTSDSIAARLSNGEFVMRAAAVSRWGAGFMAQLNAMRNPFAGFAAGGLVGRGFADGGLVTAGGTPVHLHLGGHQFALSGAGNVVDSLVVEARRQQVRSAGVKPSWFAGRPGG